MSTLTGIIDTLEKLIQRPTACCAMLSGNGVDEASLLGTKDGYLHLALALLQIVDACEHLSGARIDLDRLCEKSAFWSDNVKNALHQLPGHHPYIVGCYLFDDHESFLSALERVVNPSLPEGAKLRNDPAFMHP